MSKLVASPLPHEVRYERQLMDLPPASSWRERVATPLARAACTCGQLDTGYIEAAEASSAAQEHVQRYLPGVDWE